MMKSGGRPIMSGQKPNRVKRKMKKLMLLAIVSGGLILAGKAQAGDGRYAWNSYSRPDCDSRTVYVQPSRDCDDYGRYNHEMLHNQLQGEHRDLHLDLRYAHQDLHRELRHERAYGVPEWRIRAEHREAHRDLSDAHRDGHADLRDDHRSGHSELRW